MVCQGGWRRALVAVLGAIARFRRRIDVGRRARGDGAQIACAVACAGLFDCGFKNASLRVVVAGVTVDRETTVGELPLVVGVGASAGGLEALERFFAGVPRGARMTFVVVQHLSPDHKSLMVELLTRRARLDVRPADDGTVLAADTVYVLQPRTVVTTDGRRLMLQARGTGLPGRLPIDEFLESLAEACGARAAGVILSGTGSDGARGVRAISNAGGLVLVQSPDSSRFDGMPRAAIATGAVDEVGTPELLAERLSHFSAREEGAAPREGAADQPVADVLAEVFRATAIDFRQYRSATITRRLSRRMALRGVARVEDYLPLLRGDPEEARALGQDFLIHVTRFFRDPEVWRAVERVVVPAVLDQAGAGGVRCWVAGCATGEEAYTLAMLFAEAIAARGAAAGAVKVFATDVDRAAIDRAALGAYAEEDLRGLAEERRARHFEPAGDGYRVSRELRKMVVFAAHDVLADPPFGRLDLVVCRNVLIYLDVEAQRRVLGSFLFALRPSRYLVLGTSENLGVLADRFAPAVPEGKVFRVLEGPREPLPLGLHRPDAPTRAPAARAELGLQRLVELYAPPAVLVNDAGQVVHVYGSVAALLTLPSGPPTAELLALVPAPVRGLLNVAVTRAIREDVESRFERVRWPTPLDAFAVDVRVAPVRDRSLGRSFALVALAPLGPESPPPPAPAPEPTSGALQMLQDELVVTRENLQATVEELETSNEELQAANEEMLASNEELQSTNEELQSVNEELHTVNCELQERVQELLELRDDLDNLLQHSQVGVLFLDEELRVRRFTPGAARHVPLLPGDVGRPIEHFASVIRAGALVAEARRVVADGEARRLAYDDDDGRAWGLTIRPYAARDVRRRGVVLTFVDVTAERRVGRRLTAVVDSLPHPVAVVDREGVVTLVNAVWREGVAGRGGDPARCCEGASYLDVCDRADDPHARLVAAGLRDVLAGRAERFECEYPCVGPAEVRVYRVFAAPLRDLGGAVISHFDVTDAALVEQRLAALEGAPTP
ncbi:MAG: chemotaxis protein CheB [Polyangiales bacterium]